MPSQIKRDAVGETHFSSPVGKLHATMSRDVMRREIAIERSSAVASVSDADFYAHTLKAEKKTCKLAVRDGLGVVTTPVGALTGTARGRKEFTYDTSKGDDGFDKLLGQANLGFKHIKQRFGDEGVVGAASYGLMYGSMVCVAAPCVIVGAFGGKPGLLLGAVVGAAGAGLVGAVVGLGCVGIAQVAALPGAGLKAAGNGVGNIYGAVVAKKRAKKALAQRQAERAANSAYFQQA